MKNRPKDNTQDTDQDSTGDLTPTNFERLQDQEPGETSGAAPSPLETSPGEDLTIMNIERLQDHKPEETSGASNTSPLEMSLGGDLTVTNLKRPQDHETEVIVKTGTSPEVDSPAHTSIRPHSHAPIRSPSQPPMLSGTLTESCQHSPVQHINFQQVQCSQLAKYTNIPSLITHSNEELVGHDLDLPNENQEPPDFDYIWDSPFESDNDFGKTHEQKCQIKVSLCAQG